MGLVSKNNLSKALSVQAIEAIRILYTITEGSFTFSPLSSADVVTDTRFDTGFEKLYMEFADQETDYIFLNRQISDTIKVTDTPNLFILPAGPIPPNPSELLGSERMKFLMAYLKARYDILVIDTSPVMPATDAMLLAPMTDGTVLVIKSGMADRKVIQSAVQQYEKANLPIIGTVLNEVDLKKEGYYRYYGKYYASYYGKQA
jgi:capsular exopolysaccharide synthesis family protein